MKFFLKSTVSAFALTLCLALFSTFCGCSSSPKQESQTPKLSKNGYVVGPPGMSCTVRDPYREFTYTILDESQYNSSTFNIQVEEVINIVKDWWGNDATFVEPLGVIPVQFSAFAGGYAQDGYIFVDPFQPDTYAVVGHELIHLQNEMGLRDMQDHGYAITEMIVEDITIRILGDKFTDRPTDDQRFFEACPNLVKYRDWLEKSYKNNKKPEDVYTHMFGNDWPYVTWRLNYWSDFINSMSADNDLFCQTYLGITQQELREEMIPG